MSFRRRIFFWIILGLFIGSTAAYLAWTPYRPADLYRVIPAHAILVSSHQDLAGRWQNLSSNLIVRSLIDPSPSVPDRPKGERPAFQARQWIMRLVRKETVIAYVPAQGSTREPVWIGASWIGSSSYYRRWALDLKRIPGLDRVPGQCNGRPIWRLRQPLTESGLRLSLAFGEGIIIVCLSRNPSAMCEVLMVYDGLAPSIASSPSYRPDMRPFRQAGAQAVPASTRSAEAMDQGWFHWLQPGRKLGETLMISYAISRLDPERLEAEIGIQPALKPRAPLAGTLDIPVFGKMLGNLPALMLILPLDIIRDQLAQARVSTPAHVIREVLKANIVPVQGNNAVLALLAGDYSGGIGKEPLRIRIPTLLIFLKVREPGKIKSLVNNLADNLNAHYRLGLIIDPTSLPAGKMNVTTLETTQPCILSETPAEDRPAYAAIGQWLILSSNARSLIKLLKRYQNIETLITAPAGRWQESLEASNASVFLWMDLDVCGRVLQLPLSALALSRRGNPAQPSAINGHIIKGLKNWLENARPLKTGALWMDSSSPAPTLHLEIGEDKR